MRKLPFILPLLGLLLLAGCGAEKTDSLEAVQAPTTEEQVILPKETLSPMVAYDGWQDAYFDIIEEVEATHIQLLEVGYLEVIGGPDEAIRKSINERLKASAFDDQLDSFPNGLKLTVSQSPSFYQGFLSVREWTDYFGPDMRRPMLDRSAITFRIEDGTQVCLKDILTVDEHLKDILYSGEFVNNADGLTYEECVEFGLYDRLWASVSTERNYSSFYLDKNIIGFIVEVPYALGDFRNFEMTWERPSQSTLIFRTLKIRESDGEQ